MRFFAKKKKKKDFKLEQKQKSRRGHGVENPNKDMNLGKKVTEKR